jgi:hypothetical protein
LEIQVSNSGQPDSLSSNFAEPSMLEFEPSSAQLHTTNTLLETQNGHGFSDPWYESTVSSLNWLPYNWAPDFQVGIGNSFGSPEEIQSPDSGRNHWGNSPDFGDVADPATVHHGTPHMDQRHNQALLGSEPGDIHGI